MPENETVQDEPVTEPVAEVEPQVTEPVAETEAAVEETPHPLEPGGARFSEVYRDMKDARREAEEYRVQLERMKGQAPPPAPPKQEAWFTPDQLQTMVDGGKITPALMADQLAWQRAELRSREDRQVRVVEQRQSDAQQEIFKYIEKVPALAKPGSPDLAKIGRVAYEIAQDMGLPASDLRVQRRALRETYGSLDKLAQTQVTREASRRNADTHAETSAGGGVSAPKSSDVLKGVPQAYIDHWKRLNYTEAQMKDEAKFIKPRRQR